MKGTNGKVQLEFSKYIKSLITLKDDLDCDVVILTIDLGEENFNVEIPFNEFYSVPEFTCENYILHIIEIDSEKNDVALKLKHILEEKYNNYLNGKEEIEK